MKLNSPRGTADIYGEEIKYRDFVINTAREVFALFNFKEIITPAFEYTEVFSRSIGESTDIVQKEMYTFPDRKGRSLTLRPEGTASVVRAVIEKKLVSSSDLPLKLFYIGNMFRYERPQKGRMREFWQIGVESIGSGLPMVDAEVIWLLDEIFSRLGFRNLELRINSVGCIQCRKSFILKFKEYIKPSLKEFCVDCRRRFDTNPLRIYDCKIDKCRELLSGGPKISDFLCESCRNDFDKVISILKQLAVEYSVDDNLVRGFDYYTGIVFEMTSKELESAQNAVGGGGRYDSLLSDFGGPDIPATGFALGLDRIIMLMKELDISYRMKKEIKRVYMITIAGPGDLYSTGILKEIRDAGIICDIDYGKKSIGTGLKNAGKKGFDLAVIIGDDEVKKGIVTIKDLKRFKQQSILRSELKEKIISLTGAE